MWRGYKGESDFTYHDWNEQLEDIFDETTFDLVTDSKGVEWFNHPCAFDIETSSFYEGEEKRALMYVWQLGIDGVVFIGREYYHFTNLIARLVDYFELKLGRRQMAIYVHNLSYEFQFMSKWFDWERVFSPKNRRPLFALTKDGVEFCCSYFLSNASLAHVGDNLVNYPVKKLIGDLDYSLIRTPITPLTEDELHYCINDVRVLMSYIQEKIENDGAITEIPNTNTGYVRKYCRKNLLDENDAKKRMDYISLMKSMKVEGEEYEQLQRAFMGGFTHASCLHSYSDDLKWLENVGSADLTSSYPYTMVAQYFPMSRSRYIGAIKDMGSFETYLGVYCCIFDIEFYNLRPKVQFENLFSESKCKIEGERVINNGRVVKADKVTTTLTELDYKNALEFYVWDTIRVTNMRVYDRGYLPRSLIMSILDLYEMKTTLKGVEGREIDYLISKGMINAVYGMSVTNIVRDEVIFTDEGWITEPADVCSQLKKYNTSRNRFLFYPWGVWVTAHARDNLYSAILEFKDDYIYSDTDSIKGFNFDQHQEYFIKYNNRVSNLLHRVCGHYNIPFSKVAPKTQKGETKMLGVWEQEGTYRYFKTCGAKRYLYMYEDGFVNMTVSGLNKIYAMPYLICKWNDIPLDSEEYKKILKAYQGDRECKKWVIEQDFVYDDIFYEFGDGLLIPAGHTGKLTMTYIDETKEGNVVDYLGQEYHYNVESGIHAENQSYFMGIYGEYYNFLKGIEHQEY